jgi:ribosome maturation factor RimP
MAADLRSTLTALIEPLLTQLGYELVELGLAAGRSHAQLRLFIDRESGVGIEDCERVSHEVSALLDVHDPIPTAYTLEVSTPGLDRLLRTPAHFARFAGQRVMVELLVPRGDRRRYTGKLLGLQSEAAQLDVDGVVETVLLSEIERARLVPEWPESKYAPKRKKR